MFTIKWIKGTESESFECASYKVSDNIEGLKKDTVKVVEFKYLEANGFPQRKIIELKAKHRVFAMNRYGATHEVIECFA